jgi:hypothetical protein
MREFVNGIGCLIAVIAIVMAVASIPLFGPIPIGVLFMFGYCLYKSR